MASRDEDSIAVVAAGTRRGSVIAAAGCGKTEQIARGTARSVGRRLILTHTHAGIDALKGRLRTNGVPEGKYVLDTIAAWSLRFAAAYPARSGFQIPNPTHDDWDTVYQCAATLIGSGAMNGVLKASYAGLFVDEYQDCTTGQHAIVAALSDHLPTCVFGDPMQAIFGFRGQTPVDWQGEVYPVFPGAGQLLKPWRWHKIGNTPFAEWLRQIREQLENRQTIDLGSTPACVNFIPLPPGGSSRQASAQRQQAILGTCKAVTAGEGQSIVIIGDEANLAARAKLAKGLAKRGYTNIEPVGCRDLFDHADAIGAATGLPRLKALLEFAAICMTGIGKADLIRGVESHLGGGKLGRARFHDIIPLCLEIIETPDFDTPSRLLSALQSRPGTYLYRREMFHAMRSALRMMSTGEHDSLSDAAWQMQNRIRHTGRRIGYRSIGSTLLVKGLEFDHAVIVDAGRLTRKNLYVAMTRPSRTLTILSSSGVLNPSD